MKDWYDKLKALREADQRKQKTPETSSPAGGPDDLLQQSKALELLRDMRKIMLGSVGKIELFEDVSDYDLVLALMWNGPVSQAKTPKANSPDRCHIFIGVRGDKLYVNGQELVSNETETLQAALLKAAENPGRRKSP